MFDTLWDFWWLSIPLGIVSVVIAFFVLVVGLALWEKRLIVTYAIPEPGQELPPNDYARQANTTASQLSFQHHGTFHDAKGSLYKARYDFWLSPDSLTILVV